MGSMRGNGRNGEWGVEMDGMGWDGKDVVGRECEMNQVTGQDGMLSITTANDYLISQRGFVRFLRLCQAKRIYWTMDGIRGEFL